MLQKLTYGSISSNVLLLLELKKQLNMLFFEKITLKNIVWLMQFEEVVRNT